MEIIEENSDIDVENSCRTCLISFRDNPDRSFESIFTAMVENTMFREILCQVIPQIQIDNEKLSQYICNTCFDTVTTSYNFQKMVYENERNVIMFLDLRNELDEKGNDGMEQMNALEASDEEDNHEEQDEPNNVILPEITEVLMEDIDENIQEEVEIGSEMEEESIETSDKLVEQDEPSIDQIVVEKSYKCEVCSKEFKKLSLLSRHRKTHENAKKPHECTKCQKRFPSEVALFRHDIIHSDLVERSKIERVEEHNFVCVICNIQFRTYDLLTLHHKTHKATLGESQDIMCKLCMSPFGTFTDIIRHSRNHIENATHQCIICNKLFVLNDEAIDHFLRHKGQKPHKCPICDISFLKLHRLNNHMKTHNDDKVRLSYK
jgi:stress-induced morphogen